MSAVAAAAAAGKPAAKKPVRDSKRRASHSQIERRRREKINDRLVTLRTIVPACAAEIEERRRVRLQEEDEARRIAAGELVISSGQDSGGKRRRKRRRAAAVAAAAAAAAAAANEGGVAAPSSADKDDDLGLHKLEVLTHTIEYIYELEAQLHEIKTGVRLPPRRVIDEEDGESASANATQSQSSTSLSRPMQIDNDFHNASQWSNVARLPATHQRRSTVSSIAESSVTGYSPALRPIRGMTAESPIFAGRNGSSSDVTSPMYTSLASSMMSLSAESPLLRWNSTSTAATTPQSFTHASSAYMAAQNAKPSDRASVNDLPMLPAPAMPMDGPRQHSRESSESDTKREGTGLKRLRPAADEETGHRDAELLLALKASPDVMQPVDPESTLHSRPTVRRSSLSLPQLWRTTTGPASFTLTDASKQASTARAAHDMPATSSSAIAGKSASGGAFSVLGAPLAYTSKDRAPRMPSVRHRADSTTTMFSFGAHSSQSAPVHPAERAYGHISLPSPPLFALDAAPPSSMRTSLASPSRSPSSRKSSEEK